MELSSEFAALQPNLCTSILCSFAHRFKTWDERSVPTAFSNLLEVHRELEEVFALHGECLLVGELPLGRELLLAYQELLLLHMQHEENLLLPLYAETGEAPRFPLVLYTGQHQKLRGMLETIIARLGELSGDSRSIRRGVLAIFDQETTFKHLNEHHDGAERGGLFARLDAHVQPGRAEPIVERCWSQWWAKRGEFAGLIERARAL
jgi:hypothetical protein